ncbi:MAG: hypothetical protein ACJA2G_002345 [Cognaticolwellia sp.]|jgi:hypothetical protein
MKNFSKKLLLGGAALSVICYTYFSGNCLSCAEIEGTVDNSKTLSAKFVVAKTNLTKESASTILIESRSEQALISQSTNQKIRNLPKEKQYADDWCIADIELNERDFAYAKTQVNDWNILQGESRAKSPYSSYVEESGYPNNSLIVSYEELPLAELRELAVKGDKWAMVAYVQNPFADNKTKDEIAKELLIQGASYYALEHLVLSSISAAKTSYRKGGADKETLEHIVEAVKYVYWGAENYNLGGVGPFVSNISREPLKSNLPMEILLPTLENEIKISYQELASWVQREREERGLDVPDVPKAVKNEYAKNIAIRKQISSNEIEFLSGLNITNDNSFGNTSCVNEYLAHLNKHSN